MFSAAVQFFLPCRLSSVFFVLPVSYEAPLFCSSVYIQSSCEDKLYPTSQIQIKEFFESMKDNKLWTLHATSVLVEVYIIY